MDRVVVYDDNGWIEVLLVAGGQTQSSKYLSSTEILALGDSSWKQSGSLPYEVYGVKGVSLNNKILGTGGHDYFENDFDEVIEFDPKSEEWSQVGRMMVARSSHGISIVSAKDIVDFCVV